MAEIGDKEYYKKDKNDEWRGLGKVIRKDEKVMVIKQGGTLSGGDGGRGEDERSDPKK